MKPMMARARPSRYTEFWLVLFIGIGMIGGAAVGLVLAQIYVPGLDWFWRSVLAGMSLGLAAGVLRNRSRGPQ